MEDVSAVGYVFLYVCGVCWGVGKQRKYIYNRIETKNISWDCMLTSLMTEG